MLVFLGKHQSTEMSCHRVVTLPIMLFHQLLLSFPSEAEGLAYFKLMPKSKKRLIYYYCSWTDVRVLGKLRLRKILAVLGYCIYFDRSRRSHPDFKRKLREKRKAAAKGASNSSGITLPDFADQEAVQRFFLQVHLSTS